MMLAPVKFIQADTCGASECFRVPKRPLLRFGFRLGKWACLAAKVLMAKKSKREYVWLECSRCGDRNYRTSVSVAEGTPKLELKKFCKKERKHTVHKIRRK